MAVNLQHEPSSTTEINPKIASDVQYWSKKFNVTGDALHDAIRVHGTTVAKISAALAGHHGDAPHSKAGA